MDSEQTLSSTWCEVTHLPEAVESSLATRSTTASTGPPAYLNQNWFLRQSFITNLESER